MLAFCRTLLTRIFIQALAQCVALNEGGVAKIHAVNQRVTITRCKRFMSYGWLCSDLGKLK